MIKATTLRQLLLHHRRLVTVLAFVLLLAGYFSVPAVAQSYFPFQALGVAQFFDNSGQPLTNGVLYSYVAGTTTQQATYTDYTGTVPNNNPITFTTGGRVNIWLLGGVFYKFVLCSQNDGAFCAPADVLFSVDQVPGTPGGSAASSGAPFVTNSANPATTGIVRLASQDAICWRNAANSANLCVATDANDILYWQGQALKMQEGVCSATQAGWDYLCASSANHRWMIEGNGGGYQQAVVAGQDINNSDQVTKLHFGATATPLSGTPPSTNQYLQWNGSNIVGSTITLPGPSFYPQQRVTLGSNQSITSGVQTTLLTKSVTFPSTSGTYRALVSYGVWIVAGANLCVAEAIDTTNSTPYGFSGHNTNGSGYIGMQGSELSNRTYAANAVVVFTLQVSCNANTTATTVSTAPGVTMSPNEVTYLSITPVLTN